MQSDNSRSDWAMEDQSWEEIRQMYEDAGVPLTPEQEARYQSANEQLKSRLEAAFRSAPIELVLRLLLVTILPQQILNIVGGLLLGNAIVDHLKTMGQILTPEQLEVWQRSFNRDR